MDASEIQRRFASIESRLNRIEDALVVPAVTPWRPVDRPVVKAPLPDVPTPPMETRPGNWLGLIAIMCFVLAAGFIVKLSIDSGWLTPVRQVGLAALLGLTLIAVGLRLLRSDRAYASLLPAGGVIILYLVAYAAHRYYFLIGFNEALALTSLIALICVWLYTQIRHDAYAVTAAAGAYIAPAIFGLGTQATFTLYYFLICSAAFATIAIWVRSRMLTLIAAYLAILMSALVGMDLRQDALLSGLLAVHFLIFSISTYAYTRQSRTPLTEIEATAFLPVLVIFYAIEYTLLDRVYPGLAPWISLAFAALLFGLYLSAARVMATGLASQTLILTFATVVGFHAVYLELLPDIIQPWLLVAAMIGACFIPTDMSSLTRKNSPYQVPALAVCAIVAIEYLGLLAELVDGFDAANLLVSFVGLASIWLLIACKGDAVRKDSSFGNALLIAAHVLAITACYRLAYETGSLAISALWLLYGISVLVFAYFRRDEMMAKSALFVFAFAAGKALLYDAASAPTTIRIFCLLLTGAVLYGCGLFLRRIEKWAHPAETDDATTAG